MKWISKQRTVEPTYGSFRSRTPLRTPSGPQFTESALESELLDQLNFAPGVSDLITQAVIDYRRGARDRTYSVDLIATLAPNLGRHPAAYVIEVKRRADIDENGAEYREKFAAAQAFAQQRGAAFRIMTEAEIRTPYLGNARLLTPFLAAEIDHVTLQAIRDPLTAGGVTVAVLLTALVERGWDLPTARASVELAAAQRLVDADLSAPFNDGTVVTYDPFRRPSAADDPILVALLSSRHADRIGGFETA